MRGRREAALQDWAVFDDFVNAMERVKREPGFEALPLENRVGIRNTLAQFWRRRFKKYGILTDIQRAISLWQEALELSVEHGAREYQASFHNNLAFAFDELFTATGDRAFFEDALRHAKRSRALTDPDSPDAASHNVTFALRQMRHYQITGDLASLEQAIASLETTLPRVEDAEDRAKIEHDLSVVLAMRFQSIGDPEDAVRARELIERALAHTNPQDSEYADTLNSLALRKAEQAKASANTALLNEALDDFQIVLAALGKNAPMYMAAQHNVASLLSDRFHMTNDSGSLGQAIDIMRVILDNTPENSPDRAGRAADLGQRHLERYLATQDGNDWTEATYAFEEACRVGTGVDPGAVLRTGRAWGDAALAKGECAVADAAFVHAMAALDDLWRAQISQRYKDTWLAQAIGLHAQSAYAAACTGASREAVTRLEHGRAFTLSDNLELDRIQRDRLASQGRADLAHRLVVARDRLQIASE